MSYQAIARKFRPQVFDEVLGQDHITKTLARAIDTQRIHHAFLFTGARGVGKTSTARILAKALNCATGPTTKPCGTCKPCTEITQGINLDVLEIDGASNTGVDDVRELRENIRYLPSAGKYRIFIIDEVHMLSTSAFNALLKTLEEPPEHIIFIFATTEPHKIPETILSRCQRYDFRLLPLAKILSQLEAICQREAMAYDREALFVLAEEAAGSMRDAETLLDQILSSATDKLTAESVTQSLGLIDRKILRQALSQIVRRQSTDLLQTVRAIHEYGHDIKNFTQKLMQGMRNLAVIKSCNSSVDLLHDLLDLPEEEIKELVALATDVSLAECERLYHLLSDEYFHITHAVNQRIALEMALLRLTQTPAVVEIQTLLDEVRALQTNAPARPSSTPAGVAVKSVPAPRPPETVKPVPPSPAPIAAPKAAVEIRSNDLWEQLIRDLSPQHRKIATFLKEASPLECSAERLTIGIPASAFFKEMSQDQDVRAAICEKIKNLTQKLPVLSFQILTDTKPLQTESQERREKRDRLSEEVKSLPIVKQFEAAFGAQIEEVKNLDQKD